MEGSRPVRRVQRSLALGLSAAVLLGGCGRGAEAGRATPGGGETGPAGPGGGGAVRPGVSVLLSDSLHLVRGRRVGLVTNHTGIGLWPPVGAPDTIASSVDLLHDHPEVELVALYSPEHGLAGAQEAGRPVPSGRHARTGLPIFSLYGEARRPLPHTLEGVEVLLYDIQDIGSRYYTYVSTMALAMEAAGEAGVPFVVLDRPNPIDGVHVQGNVLDPAFASFVGPFPIPMRHGMTPGELARLFRGGFGVEAELHVVPADGWRRDIWFDATGLPWVAPSPNMPSLESATHYPGTCLFEGTNLSVGRGTDVPFQVVGAPWLDGDALAARLRARLSAAGIGGVRVEPARFTPRRPGDGKYEGEEVRGIRLTVTDRETYDPPSAAVAALLEARRLAGPRWEWRAGHFDRLAGTDRLRAAIEAGAALDSILAAWRPERERFERLRRGYLIY